MDAGSMVIEGSSMMSVFDVTLELYEATLGHVLLSGCVRLL